MRWVWSWHCFFLCGWQQNHRVCLRSSYGPCPFLCFCTVCQHFCVAPVWPCKYRPTGVKCQAAVANLPAPKCPDCGETAFLVINSSGTKTRLICGYETDRSSNTPHMPCARQYHSPCLNCGCLACVDGVGGVIWPCGLFVDSLGRSGGKCSPTKLMAASSQTLAGIFGGQPVSVAPLGLGGTITQIPASWGGIAADFTLDTSCLNGTPFEQKKKECTCTSNQLFWGGCICGFTKPWGSE